MRRTKIVCTIGPATSSEERLEQLMRAGMNVARLNFSHGTHAEHEQVVKRVRAISARLGCAVAVLQDLQGPKIRTGTLQDGKPVTLVEGSPITITTRDVVGNAQIVSTTYKALPLDVKTGDRILLDDGLLELRVLGASETDVQCEVVYGGELGEHKGINLPGVAVSSPALTEKDRVDLRFGIELGVDYVALSFVRETEDVHEAQHLIRQYINEVYGEKDERDIPLIVKIEKPEAVEHLDAILAVTDGVMVARGDLGVEMPAEKVPLIQKRIISKCNELGLPVITATQMLESMITNPRPTRAEVSDVSTAILEGSDAVMLSAETSVGAFPIDAVRMMARIALETEANYHAAVHPIRQHRSLAQAVSHAARALAEDTHVQDIVVFTRSGNSARLISNDRPRVPILAYTPSDHVYHQLALWWGVWPHHISMQGTTENLIALVEKRLLEDGLAQPGEYVVIMGGLPIASQARTNFVKLHRVESSL
ncbi:MAG TPA: pyruvate kinase [Ktedonobacteraceae bacterium]|nr:pyruvate kinase [Ktedonobacteraceae bacterium]